MARSLLMRRLQRTCLLHNSTLTPSLPDSLVLAWHPETWQLYLVILSPWVWQFLISSRKRPSVSQINADVSLVLRHLYFLNVFIFGWYRTLRQHLTWFTCWLIVANLTCLPSRLWSYGYSASHWHKWSSVENQKQIMWTTSPTKLLKECLNVYI